MPLVFVHGVNVRTGAAYDREFEFRRRHFVDIFYHQLGRQVGADDILSPYWGDLGANLSPDLPFLPRGGYELLWQRRGQELTAPKSDIFDTEVLAKDSATPLLDIARQASVDEVIDLLWEVAEREMLEIGAEQRHTDEEMNAFARRALEFAHSEEGEKWLQSLKSDDELLDRLSGLLHGGNEPKQMETDSTRAAGRLSGIIRAAGGKFRSHISETRERVAEHRQALRARIADDFSAARLHARESVVSTTARLINEPLRALFHAQCALLIGDAFAYFNSRGGDGPLCPIGQRIMDDLTRAAEMANKSGEQLIVVGHSMGGVILCDLVTSYGKDIPIDVLITVGSQFPLFADLGMFRGVNDLPRPIPKPANVKRWLNIFDPHDILGYPASHLFADVADFHLPTYAMGASAHANYFNRRSFYFHLARRMEDYVPKAPAKR
jgi:hypothetical protein